MTDHRPTALNRAALTIAGSDSCGGAGIQTDLAAFQHFRVHGASVITAVTAQNTRGVHDALNLPPDLIRSQIDAVLQDLPIKAIKTGMLPDRAAVTAVLEGLHSYHSIPLVVDPVMIATSGARLMQPDTLELVRKKLLPATTLLTPNVDEAAALCGRKIHNESDLLKAGYDLLDLGCRAVLLKGGHLSGNNITDILLGADHQWRYSHPRRTGEYHGSGCTLAAAICAQLTLGRELPDAVETSLTYLQRRMQHAQLPLQGSSYLLGTPDD